MHSRRIHATSRSGRSRKLISGSLACRSVTRLQHKQVWNTIGKHACRDTKKAGEIHPGSMCIRTGSLAAVSHLSHVVQRSQDTVATTRSGNSGQAKIRFAQVCWHIDVRQSFRCSFCCLRRESPEPQAGEAEARQERRYEEQQRDPHRTKGLPRQQIYLGTRWLQLQLWPQCPGASAREAGKSGVQICIQVQTIADGGQAADCSQTELNIAFKSVQGGLFSWKASWTSNTNLHEKLPW